MLVSWNASVDLPDLIANLRAQRVLGLELVVVDNGSVDGSAQLIERLYPQSRVTRLSENIGFAGAADLGITRSRGDSVALLNYDVRLHPGYLHRCLEALDGNPGLGSVQGVLLRPGGYIVDSAGHVATRGRWVRNRGENLAASAGPWAPASTFGVSAAAAVYRRTMLDQVRGVTGHVFDPAFFAYLEDVDLDWRARWLGWEAGVVEGATAEHVHSGSGARRRPELQRHIIKNRLLVLYRNEDRGSLLRDLPWIAAQMLARWVWASVTCPSSLLGIVDFVRLWPQQRTARRAIVRARVVGAAQMRAWFGRGSAGVGFGTRTRDAGSRSRASP